MNDLPLVQLTLAYPRAVERQLLAELLETQPPLGGFTTLLAEGHGHGFDRASVEEMVRGRADRCLLHAVTDRVTALGVIQRLREVLPSPEIAYWLVPIEAFGRLA